MEEPGRSARPLARYGRFFISIAAAAGCMWGAVHIEASRQEKAAAFFAAALRESNAPSADNTSFAALRSNYAQLLSARAPLFALAGTDPQKLEAALGDLRLALQGLQGQQRNPKDAALLSSLYPLEFLQTAAAAEEARQAFLKDGTLGNEQRYRSALRRSISAYHSDLEAFRFALLRAVPASMRTYTAGGLLIHRAYLLAAIDKLEEGSAAQAQNLRSREQCLAGYVAHCDTSALKQAVEPVPATEGSLAANTLSLSAMQDLSAAAGKPLDSGEPLVRLNSSACIEFPMAPVFGFYSPTIGSAARSGQVAFVGDLRFIRPGAYQSEDFFSYFRAQGVVYIPNNPLTHYTCPAVAHDIAGVFWVQAVAQFSKEHSIPQLYPLAQKLSIKNPIEEQDAEAYATKAVMLATNGALAPDVASAITQLAVAKHNRSAGLDRSVELVAAVELNNLRAQSRGMPIDLQAQTLFYFRSGFLAFFGAENPSISGLAEAPLPSFSNTAADAPFVYFSKLPRTLDTETQIYKDLHTYARTHE